ncbi:MAG: S8 family peptidase [Nocardioides sp.]
MSARHPRLAAALLAATTSAALVLAPTAATADRPAKDKHIPADAGPAPVHGTSASDHYIVVFDKGSSNDSVREAKDKAKDKGAKVHHTYSNALDGFAATLSESALTELRNNKHVSFIEADRQVSVSDTQSPATWGIDRIDQRNLPLNNSYTYQRPGAGVKAYFIDTGMRRSHAEFSGRATSGYSAINDGRGTDDCHGHGTHVAGTVGGETYGVAQDVSLVAVRVLDCTGNGTDSGVIAGIDWVTGNHTAGTPAVANMSLGGGVSSALDTAVNNSINDGITYALAAGNDNGANACNSSPSRVAAGLTVGSTTSTDARSSFSNIGSCLDLFAPGSSITSSWIGSDSATNTISGTSMATPHVAGAAAVYLQGNPGASPATVNSAIISSATTGKVTNPGTGSPNRLLYSDPGGTPPPPPPTGCSSLPETATGSLGYAGDLDYHPGPNGYYFSSVSGTHVGCLDGPSGVDFDLYLEKWNGSSWVVVAQSISSGPDEQISYSGTSGNYSWRVESYTGSGSYTFGFDRP